MHPGIVRACMATSEAQRRADVNTVGVDQFGTRSKTLAASKLFGIYNLSHFTRFEDCLRAEFPILSYALGENLFGLLTFSYLQSDPTRGYAHRKLADNFHQYLTQWHTDSVTECDTDVNWTNFIIDLVTIERAFSELLNGASAEDEELLDPDKSIRTSDQFMEFHFTPVACLKLLAFHYPVSKYIASVINNENPTFPKPSETFLAMTHRYHAVCIHELTQVQFKVLSALVAGQTLNQVVSLACNGAGRIDPSRESLVFAWINDWTEKAFFAGIEL